MLFSCSSGGAHYSALTLLSLWLLINVSNGRADPSIHAAPVAPQHTNNWAVLVSTSRFWLNYRHIVNTMSMYHVVKRLGISDSNIILMLPDDMACNPRNPMPAQLFNNESHALDVYGQDVEVDYRGYEVTVSAFLQLLTGRHAPDVPRSKRLMSDADSNLLIFMSGHGGDEFIKFNDVEELLAQDLADAMAQMAEKGRYREALLIVDTCEAATLVQRIKAPNVITIASSQKGQQSFAHKTDGDLGLSLIDRFTYQTLAFFEDLDITSSATLANLFDTYSYNLMRSNFSYRMTNAMRRPSHVQVTEFFGSVVNARTESDRGPQDVMYHGDINLGRYMVAYLDQDNPEGIDEMILQQTTSNHFYEGPWMCHFATMPTWPAKANWTSALGICMLALYGLIGILKTGMPKEIL